MKKTICLEYGYYKSSAKLFFGGENKTISLYLNNDHCQTINTQILLTNEQILKLKGHMQLDYEFLCSLGEMKIGNDLCADDNSLIISKFRLPPEYFHTLCSKSNPIIINNQITRGMIMSCFVFTLFNNILKYNPDYLDEDDREDIKILVGSLADRHWGSDEAVSQYAHLIKSASHAHRVEIILM